MDAISYSHSVKQEKRIKRFIANPDSNSGIVTVPKVIGAGESVTIPSGRVAVLPNVQVDGTLNIEGEVFIPTGATFGDLEKGLLPIGAILNAYTIFDNCIVAFGGEFNRADYPKLWAYLQANPSLVKTQAQWQTEALANGGICGFYSSGNGTTTFRVPNINEAFLRPSSRGVGSYQKDGIANHEHRGFYIGATGSGHAFSYGIGSNSISGGVSAVSVSTHDGNLNNGLRNTTTTDSVSDTRPINIAVLPLIVAK